MRDVEPFQMLLVPAVFPFQHLVSATMLLPFDICQNQLAEEMTLWYLLTWSADAEQRRFPWE